MNPTPILIHDDLWEKLLEWTDGAAAVCYQCGVCTATCPWGLVRPETVSIRSYLRAAQTGAPVDGQPGLWLCTSCGQCEVYCPRGVKISDVFRGLRYLAWEQNQPPAGLPTLLWSLFWNNNPWGQPPSQRLNWARGLDLPTFDPQKHDILYYVGCTASYDTRAQNIARALVAIFQAVGVRFGVLGEEEPCSGEEALSVGHQPFFQEIAEKASTVFKARGVTRIVTTDPHSYDAFLRSMGDDCQPLHYTQYLAQLLEEGRLPPALLAPLPCKVTLHDPCYLARHHQEVEAPRALLQAIPQIELIETRHHGVDTLCCGGGGGRMWIDTAAGERFSDLRVAEIAATGAEVLATACPYCIACLDDSVKARGLQDLEVLDIAEILALSIQKASQLSHEREGGPHG